MTLLLLESDGWYEPGNPPPQQRSLIALAQQALEAERAGNDDERLDTLRHILNKGGLAGTYLAMAYWCDQFVDHARGPNGNPGPMVVDFEIPEMGREFRWVADLIAARALQSRETWAWLISELPNNEEWGVHVDILLQFGVCIIERDAQIVEDKSSDLVTLIPLMEMPHRWRDCRLGVAVASEVDPQQVALAQRVVDILWNELSASDRRLVHGYVCLGRRDKVSRDLMRRFAQQNAQFHPGGSRAKELGGDPTPGRRELGPWT